jgi:hypothetical protein
MACRHTKNGGWLKLQKSGKTSIKSELKDRELTILTEAIG